MITSEDILRLARTLRTHQIPTIGGQSSFQVEVVGGSLHFTLASTGRTRVTPLATLEKVLDIYNNSKSLSCKTYRDTTYNASYILGLISRLQQAVT